MGKRTQIIPRKKPHTHADKWLSEIRKSVQNMKKKNLNRDRNIEKSPNEKMLEMKISVDSFTNKKHIRTLTQG